MGINLPAVEKYTLRKGDTIAKVAFQHGIVNWRKDVWAAPKNRDVRKEFKEPKHATPGTVIYLPNIKAAPGQIYASVGAGKKFANRPDDVKEIKKLLNRWAEILELKQLSPDGKTNAEFFKFLRKFQKQILGRVDGVVHPKGKTFAALRQPLPKIAIGGPIEVKVGGKKYRLTHAFVEKTNKEISASLIKVGQIHLKHVEGLETQCMNICTGKGKAKDTFQILLRSKNLHHFTSALKEIRVCKKKIENFISNSRTTKTAKLKKVVSVRYHVQDLTNQAGAAFDKAMKVVAPAYQAWIDVLELTRDTSFAIVETYLAAVLANPIAAGAVVGAGKEASGQIGTAAFVYQKWKNNGGLANSIEQVIKSGRSGALWAVGGVVFGKVLGAFSTRFAKYMVSKGFTSPAFLKGDLIKYFGVASGPNVIKFDTQELLREALDNAVSTVWNKSGEAYCKEYYFQIADSMKSVLESQSAKGAKVESALGLVDKAAKSKGIQDEISAGFLKKYKKEILKHLKSKSK